MARSDPTDNARTPRAAPAAAGATTDRETRGAIPSTLDPDIVEDANTVSDLAEELGLNEAHGADDGLPGAEELPEDALARQVEDAAEGMPTDTPADRADQSDQRDEIQPRR